MKVYYPHDNDLERALQDASHYHTGQWLSEVDCKLMSDAIVSLKITNYNWISNLIKERTLHFFNPNMISNQDILVFVTYPLYIQDIIENKEFNSYLHSPVIFLTKPLAHYLFKEYTIHLHIDKDKLVSLNSTINFTNVGGLLISEDNVALNTECIVKVVTFANKNKFVDKKANILDEIKLAASLVAPGIFQIDEHERALLPNKKVRDKEKRADGVIVSIEPGETGCVQIKYNDESFITIGKQFFDQRFSLV